MSAFLGKRIDRFAQGDAVLDPWTQAQAYLDLALSLDESIADLKPALLKRSAEPWSADDRRAAEDIAEHARRLGAAGVGMVERCMRQGPEGKQRDLLLCVIGMVLSNLSIAIKWSLMSRQRRTSRFDDLHALFRMAEDLKGLRSEVELVREGFERTACPESLYISALLLPVVSASNFLPREIEIADELLLAWTQEYTIARSAESGEPALWIDVQGSLGPRLAQFRPDGRSVRLIVLAKMRAHLRAAMHECHLGTAPAAAMAADFGLDVYARVLEHFGTFLGRVATVTSHLNGRRSAGQPPGAEIFVALDDILRGAPGQPDGTVTVREESDGEARIVLRRALWDRLEPGQLVGLRSAADAPLTVALVSRKFEASSDFEWTAGIEWIGRAARPVALNSRETSLVPRKMPGLYLPGTLPSGADDMLLTDDGAADETTRYDVKVGELAVTLRPSRTRHKGRGWLASAFEVEAVPLT